jgi:redox-sensitive bicupin YhaK (pirin superfamily)
MMMKREIAKKWTIQLDRKSALHKSGFILQPGNWELFDPFLIMAEDVMQKGAFSHHPHRGIETVTYVINGELEHTDNAGNTGRLYPGDVQWMSAGKGILHNEEAPAGKEVHTLQLWVNLPADQKMSLPRYQDIVKSKTPLRKTDGAEYRVISGRSGNVTSDTKNYVAVTLVEITIEAGFTATQDLEADYNAFIYVLDGSGIFGENQMPGQKNDVLLLKSSANEHSEIHIKATNQKLKILVIAGKPLREPVAIGGPFVMNTPEQIQEAYADYRAGKFGVWTGE